MGLGGEGAGLLPPPLWPDAGDSPSIPHTLTPISTLLMRGGVSGLTPPANLHDIARGPRQGVREVKGRGKEKGQ